MRPRRSAACRCSGPLPPNCSKITWIMPRGGGQPATLAELGHRLGGEGTLIGHAANPRDAAGGALDLSVSGSQQRIYRGPAEAVNRAADTYAGTFAVSGTLGPLDIEVTGISDLKDYASSRAISSRLTFISHVGVEALSGDTRALPPDFAGRRRDPCSTRSRSTDVCSRSPPARTGCSASNCSRDHRVPVLARFRTSSRSEDPAGRSRSHWRSLHHQLLLALGLFCGRPPHRMLSRRLSSPSDSAGRALSAAVLDPAADKLLLATSFVVLAIMHLVPLWLMATAVARDLDHRAAARSPIGCGSGRSRRARAAEQAQHIVSGAVHLCVIARQQLACRRTGSS